MQHDLVVKAGDWDSGPLDTIPCSSCVTLEGHFLSLCHSFPTCSAELMILPQLDPKAQ